jgi:hypothetical protein
MARDRRTNEAAKAVRPKTRTAADSGGDRRSPDLGGIRRRDRALGRAPEQGDRTAGRETAPDKPPTGTSS